MPLDESGLVAPCGCGSLAGRAVSSPRRDLHGRVLEGGVGVGAAKLSLRNSCREIQVSSAADGSFRFKGMCPDLYDLIAVDGARVAHAIVRLGAKELAPVTLSLAEGGFVRVTIVDEDDRPIVAARVELGGGFEGVTDTHGETRIGPLPAGHHALFASAPQHREADDASFELKPGDEVALRVVLPRRVAVSGVVSDAQGRPLGQIRLRAMGTSDAGARVELGSAWSEPDGKFQIDDLPAGEMALELRGEAVLPARKVIRAPAAGVRVSLSSGLSVAGTVVDEADRAVPHAAIWGELTASRDDEPPVQRWVTADESGRFAIRGLPSGTLALAFQARARSHADPLSDMPQGETRIDLSHSVEGLVLRFDGAASLAGMVTDPGGQPIPRATVMAVRDEPRSPSKRGPPRARSGVVQSDDDGRFAFSHLPPGQYKVRAWKQGFANSAPAAFATRERQAKITLRRLGAVHGFVVRENGEPITSFNLNGRAVDDPRGEFRVAQDRESQPELHIVLGARDRTSVAIVREVEVGQTVELGDVTLPAGRTISGHVVTATGAPIERAFVIPREQFPPELLAHIAPGGVPSSTVAETNVHGEFVMEHMPPDAFTLSADAEGFGPASTVVGVDAHDVTITLQAAAALEGRAVDVWGHPLRGSVSVWVSGRPLVGSDAALDAMGAYELHGLPAGEVVVALDDFSHPPAVNSGLGPKSVVLAPGSVTRVDFIASSGGRLVVNVPSSAGRRAWIALLPGAAALPTSSERLAALWRGAIHAPLYDGTWTCEGLDDGEYTIVLVVQSGRQVEAATRAVSMHGPEEAITLDPTGLHPVDFSPGE